MEYTWSYGSVVVLEKDAVPDPTWSHGRPVLNYEYEAAAGGNSPTSVFYGPFYGPFGGPL